MRQLSAPRMRLHIALPPLSATDEEAWMSAINAFSSQTVVVRIPFGNSDMGLFPHDALHCRLDSSEISVDPIVNVRRFSLDFIEVP
jgi:hypothetical protein